jgi:hypothetical protein
MPFLAKNIDEVEPSHPLPQRLNHRPIYAFPYEKFDGLRDSNTDARYITVGLSQWDWNEISVKMLRHSKEKWTRQSEELPVYRILDMTLFLIHVLYLSENDQIVIPKGTFHNQNQEIIILKEELSSGELKGFDFAVNDSNLQSLLKERFNKILEILNKLKTADAI